MHQTSLIRRKYYIDKICIKMGGLKIAKNPMKKKGWL
jgi:hypothetical protein